MEYLKAAAQKVEQQALKTPGLGIPVDPDVADYMGAFFSEEDLADVIEGGADEEI
nr:hypothetical protein [uncultured Desulfobulbus sp.]